MSLLSSATVVAQFHRALLERSDLSPADLRTFGDHEIELLRETLAQIEISHAHPEHEFAVVFTMHCLAELRGKLVGWDVSAEKPGILAELPLPLMPRTDRCWYVKHPSKKIFFEDVEAGLVAMRSHPEAFTGEPWEWLLHFLEGILVAR